MNLRRTGTDQKKSNLMERSRLITYAVGAPLGIAAAIVGKWTSQVEQPKAAQ